MARRESGQNRTPSWAFRAVPSRFIRGFPDQKKWDSMARASTRRVARKMGQAGAPISHMTVARWRSRGWRPLEREQHPLEAARARLDDGVPLLTGDAMTVAEVLGQVS